MIINLKYLKLNYCHCFKCLSVYLDFHTVAALDVLYVDLLNGHKICLFIGDLHTAYMYAIDVSVEALYQVDFSCSSLAKV